MPCAWTTSSVRVAKRREQGRPEEKAMAMVWCLGLAIASYGMSGAGLELSGRADDQVIEDEWNEQRLRLYI
jgi:hypothetical protein